MKLSGIIRQKSPFSIYLIVSYLVISCVWTSFCVDSVVGQAVHDIAITGVTANTTVVAPGEPVKVMVQVENQGDFDETFNVSAYYNSSLIATQSEVSLNAGNSTVLNFIWDTTGVPVSLNTLKANATVHAEEIDTADNEYIDGKVAVTWTKVYLSPTPASSNPLEFFTLSINVSNVTDLWSFALFLRWRLDLLDCLFAVEGPFLSRNYTQSTSWVPPNINNLEGYMVLGNRIQSGGTSVNGTGILANVTFTVEKTGDCILELYRVSLRDSNGVSMPPNTGSPDYFFMGLEHGYFYTTHPVASFEMSPDPGTYLWRPIVGEPVIFNASTSYDPDDPYDLTPGGITSYSWDFGDETNETTNDPVTTHTFATAGTYSVALNVTDDENDMGTVEYPQLGIKLHDIALVNVTVYPLEVAAGATVTINATALNEGSVMEYLNITAYYDYYPIEERIFNYSIDSTVKVTLSPGKNGTCTILWDTTGLAPGTYMIGAKVWLIQDSGVYRGVSLDEWEADKTDNAMFAGAVTLLGAPVHDLAVTAVTVDPTNIPLNQVPYIDVTVRNEGNIDETFNATVYYNSTLIGTKTDETLPPGHSAKLTFTWSALTGTDTTQEGTYIIMANVTIVTNETDTADNSKSLTKTMQMLPFANFTHSPTPPAVSQTIEFDASSSYLPGIPAPGEPPRTIESYHWDFGDGTTGTGEIVYHTYNRRSTYSVTLTVTDNKGLAQTYWKSVSVGHNHDVAVINVAPLQTEIPPGAPVTVNVTVTNYGTSNKTFTVNLYYNDTVAATPKAVTDLAPSANMTLIFSWRTVDVAAGIYTLKAIASQAANETYLEDNTLLSNTVVTVLKLSSNINLTASPTTLTTGGSSTFTGSITPQREGVDVTIWTKASGEDWIEHATVTSDADGGFSYSWTPPSAGSYGIKVSWAGDDITYGAESDVQVADVQEALTSNMFLYTTIAFAVLSAVIAAYFIWIKKPKSA